MRALGNDMVDFKRSDQSLVVGHSTRDLERLVLGNKTLYKESALCRLREQRYSERKKSRKSLRTVDQKPAHRMNQSGTMTSTQIESHSHAGSGTDTELTSMEMSPAEREFMSGNAGKLDLVDEQLESSPINVRPSEEREKRMGNLKKAHPQNLRCEGCGHSIDFAVDYDHIITYRVPILEEDEDRYFYFHDTFCVV